ncbi:MAG TPA: CsgG/HfaB family protein [Moraxellaceae bacterium]|nr:CsgG/HfaB family protein [Moraxellaceae bacterium]
MSRLTLTGLAMALSLTACASGPAPLTQQELQAAQQGGNLEGLYDQYALRLAGQKLTTPEGQKAVAQLNEIGNQLASRLEQDIHSTIQQQSTASGLAPLPVIDAQIARLPPMQKWSPEKHSRLTAELNDLRGRTQARITAQQNQLARFTENELGQRVAVLDDLARLTGDDRYSRESADVVATLRRKADEALKTEQYGEARQALTALQQVAPEDKTVRSQITLANARLFEKKFWDSLADGKLDDAYTQFMNLSQTPEFPDVMKRLSKSSDDMVAYFIAQAGVATNENRLADAYKLINQANDLRTKTGSTTTARSPQEDAFAKAVSARSQDALKAGHTGLALGYLKVVEHVDPDYPGLRASLRTTMDATLGKATRKVSTAAFTDATGSSEFGGAVAAKVTQHLFDKIPNDIRIIERDQFQAILREKEIGASQNSDLATADLLIQGKILESRVDTTENRSKKTMRVVTDTSTVPNPAYDQWAALPEAQRSKLAEPARTVTQEKKEDITINLQIMRKVGIISASYRLVEARTGKVIATGSESAKAEFTDEGNEGIELGQFRMPFKLASLPADTEILQKLTDKISDVIGDKLVQELKEPEKRYAETAKRYNEEADPVMAAENQAYAFALANLKGQDTTTLRLALEQYALKAP